MSVQQYEHHGQPRRPGHWTSCWQTGQALVLVLLCLQAARVGGGLATGQQGDSGGAAALVGRAERHFKAGKLADALADLEQAVTEAPHSPRPLVAMATVLLEAKRDREAVAALRRAAEMHRHAPDLSARESEDGAEGFGIATRAGLLANLATWLYQTGDASGAADACQEALVVQPLHARCYYILGVAMLSSGRWRNEGGAHAASSLAVSVRLFSTTADRANALFALGSLRLRVGQMAQAASSFEAALRLAPNRHEVLMRVGEMRSRFAWHAAALDAFQAAERLRPEHAEATIQCGNALRRLKKLAQALIKYKEAASHPSASQSDKAEALYWIGSVREMQGKTSKAEKAYRKALEADAGHARTLNNLGSLLMSRSDDQARDLYRRATMADPHMFEAYNNLGGHLLVQGEAEEAVPLLEWAYQLDQTEPQLIFNLGLARRQAATAAARKSAIGEESREVEVAGGSGAVGLMRQALRMRSDNKDYYWELARTYLYSDQPGLVLATLEAMTRTLRGGWGGAAAAVDADRWIHESSEASGLREYAPPLPPARPDKAKVRGVILFLCCADDDELRDLHFSLRRLHDFFTSRFQYPVLILHDRLDRTQQLSLENAFNPSALSFLKIQWDMPPDMSAVDRSAVPPKLFLAGHSWSIGYRHMSRFFCKGLFELPELVDKYDYYWRLDADSFLLRPVRQDPFMALRDSGREYGYIVVTQEDEAVVRGLWNTTLAYMKLRGLSMEAPGFLRRHLNADGQWNRNMYYTNFEISSLAFWRSPAYLDFFDHIDKSNGIYMHRWGDAPIHLLAVALLLPEDRVLQFSQIAYWHQYYVNLPTA